MEKEFVDDSTMDNDELIDSSKKQTKPQVTKAKCIVKERVAMLKKNLSRFIENIDDEKLKRMGKTKIQQLVRKHRNTETVRLIRQQCNDTQEKSHNSSIIPQGINLRRKKSSTAIVNKKKLIRSNEKQIFIR